MTASLSLSNIQRLPLLVVRHHLLGLLNVSQILKEAMPIALQVLIGLVPVQVAIPLRVELEHLVAEGATDVETLLECLLRLQLVLLHACVLSVDLAHLETEGALLLSDE